VELIGEQAAVDAGYSMFSLLPLVAGEDCESLDKVVRVFAEDLARALVVQSALPPGNKWDENRVRCNGISRTLHFDSSLRQA
jgi:hypothetical protein